MVALYPYQLSGRLKPLPPLVLLWGDDAGALRQTAQQVMAATGVDVNDPFAAEKITLNDLLASPSRLADSAQTMSFTSPHRLIVVQGISGDESAAQIAGLTQAVKAALEFDLQAVTIVLAVPRALEKNSALVKTVEAHERALAVRFFVDSAGDLSGFLRGEFQSAGVAVTAEAVQAMAANLGADREVARREVEKVIVYAGEESPVTEEHVAASLAGAIPADAFRLAEAVGSRSRGEVGILEVHLVHQGEDLTSAFTLVLRHLQSLKAAQEMKGRGEAPGEILKLTGKLKAPKNVQQAFLDQVERYPAGRLATLPDYALETLSQARSGLLEGNLVLGRAILSLSV